MASINENKRVGYTLRVNTNQFSEKATSQEQTTSTLSITARANKVLATKPHQGHEKETRVSLRNSYGPTCNFMV